LSNTKRNLVKYCSRSSSGSYHQNGVKMCMKTENVILTDIGHAVGDHVLVVVHSTEWNGCLKRCERRHDKQLLHSLDVVIDNNNFKKC